MFKEYSILYKLNKNMEADLVLHENGNVKETTHKKRHSEPPACNADSRTKNKHCVDDEDDDGGDEEGSSP